MPSLFRDWLFVALSVTTLVVAFLGTAEAPAVRVGAVTAVVALLAIHLRLAFGGWRAWVQTVGGCFLLWALGASSPLVAAAAAAGVVATVAAAGCARRACIVRAGALAGLAAAVVLMTPLLQALRPPFASLGADVMAAVGGGVVGSLLVLALSPGIEWLFGHVTRLTLGELLSYDHPLLRKLSTEAPGTFQHAINVGVLADAAAQAIGADALMARAGSLYHDVGKTGAPEYFVENQTDRNPHDGLPPEESARILKAHVTDGVELVLGHHLGERVARFVREHHGTSLMRSLAQDSAGDADQFRYPGPRPQSRETAVVMMADQLEATARAERPPDAAASLRLVRETIARIADESQLVESGLSPEELAALEPAFARAIDAMYHRRMRYPRPQQRLRPARVAELARSLRPRRAQR